MDWRSIEGVIRGMGIACFDTCASSCDLGKERKIYRSFLVAAYGPVQYLFLLRS